MARERREPEDKLETDPRFPSGRWTGFWLQRDMPGRQYMSLGLTFCNGVLSGTGCDRVGDFDFSGSYDLDDGSIRVLKRYVRAHVVEYEGRNEEDGKWIWGLWNIRNLDRGGFHLWPEGEDDPTKQQLRREQGRPVEQERRRLKLEPLGTP